MCRFNLIGILYQPILPPPTDPPNETCRETFLIFFVINFIYTGEALVHSSFLGRSSADGTRAGIQVGTAGTTAVGFVNSVKRSYVQVTYKWENIYSYTLIQLYSLNLKFGSLSSCEKD